MAAQANAQTNGIAVMTSGGDAQGMNPAIRAITRVAVLNDVKVFGINEGYQGLVDGNISQLLWDDVSGLLSEGGTSLGSSRCLTFKNDILVRRTAVFNLVSRGIDNLICIGGDGSLTGADKLREEWPEHVKALVEAGKLDKSAIDVHKKLKVVGLVGSIDNDMCGTDITIGAYSALTRIIEALDAITTTASSHQRLFVVEIMGRNCGWLTLQSGLATGADWVFIPEAPPKGDWKERLVKSVRKRRENGARYNLLLVAEGAVDLQGGKITVQDVKKTLEDEAGFDTRITILGHIQRGGVPCAADRTIGTLVGLKAAEILLSPEIVSGVSKTDSWLVGMKGGEVTCMDLMEAVNLTKSVATAMEAKQWEKAFQLRGPDFALSWNAYKTLARAFPHEKPAGAPSFNVAILHVGPPSPGMNGVVRSLARHNIEAGNSVLAYYNGFMGAAIGDSIHMKWRSVSNWVNTGGALLGTNRTQPSQVGLDLIAVEFERSKINALFIIGGWEAYTAAFELYHMSSKFPQFRIPISVIPSTISNNCAGTDYTIGSDTALNTIVNASDTLKKSATSSRCRVFVMETMGGKCGYLTLMAAIAGGAQIANIPETGLTLKRISADIERLQNRFKHCRSTSLILHSEKASKTYTTDLLAKILQEESEGYYDVRHLTLGHLQQGNYPSPIDRIRGISLAHKAVHDMQQILVAKQQWVGAVGIVGGQLVSTSHKDLFPLMDFKNRRPKVQWWFSLNSVVQALRGRPKDDEKYRPLSATMFKNVLSPTPTKKQETPTTENVAQPVIVTTPAPTTTPAVSQPVPIIHSLAISAPPTTHPSEPSNDISTSPTSANSLPSSSTAIQSVSPLQKDAIHSFRRHSLVHNYFSLRPTLTTSGHHSHGIAPSSDPPQSSSTPFTVASLYAALGNSMAKKQGETTPKATPTDSPSSEATSPSTTPRNTISTSDAAQKYGPPEGSNQ